MKSIKLILSSLLISFVFTNIVGQSEDELFNKARDFDKNEQYAQALDLFSQLIIINPSKANYYRWRSEEYLNLSKYPEALNDINTAIQKSTEIDAYDYWRRGRLYYYQAKYDLAMADFNTAVKLNKTVYYFYSWRAYCYSAQKQIDLALQEINTAIGIDSTKSTLFSSRADYKLQKKDYLGAIQDGNNAIRLDSRNAGAYITPGICYYQLQKYQMAYEYYQKSYNVNPNSANKANLSMGIARIGRTDEALNNLDNVIAESKADTLKRSYGYYYFMKARIYGFNNMKDECLANIKLAFQNGFSSINNFAFESYFYELTPIHNEPEFMALVKENNMAVPAAYTAMLASSSVTKTSSQTSSAPQQVIKTASQETSDIDSNIPQASKQNPYRFALIIGNEDYSSFQRDLNNEVNVEFAVNDANTFKEYAVKTLGVPSDQVILLTNAKSIEMDRAFRQISLISKNSNGKAEIIFYYAGHGFPDEVTKEPYLIPVDVSANDLKYAFKLADIYKQFTEFPNKKVTVFLDACFSGGARNQGLVAARGVKVKPKENMLTGNLVVFSASSGDQSAMPYKEKGHGLFTYFLLKKLQESKGQTTYKELSEYISEQVGLKSVLVNKKEQNAQTNTSMGIKDIWSNWGF